MYSYKETLRQIRVSNHSMIDEATVRMLFDANMLDVRSIRNAAIVEEFHSMEGRIANKQTELAHKYKLSWESIKKIVNERL